MKSTLPAFLVCSFVLIPLVQAQSQLPAPAAVHVEYEKDVKPLLAQNCYSCHGEVVQQSGLRLDLRQNALRGGDTGRSSFPARAPPAN